MPLERVTTEQEVYNFLSLHGPSSANTMQEKLGIPQQTIARALLKLANAGKLSVLSFPQKLYTVKHKPHNMQALLATIMCTVVKLHDAYEPGLDAKVTETLRAEMLRWSTVINELEDNEAGNEVQF